MVSVVIISFVFFFFSLYCDWFIESHASAFSQFSIRYRFWGYRDGHAVIMILDPIFEACSDADNGIIFF